MRAEPHDRAPLALAKSRAAYYGMYLTRVCGYAPDEAAALIVARYPEVQPWLLKYLRRTPAEPQQEARHAASA